MHKKVIDDPFCNNCGKVETLQHYFVDCEETRLFWNDLAQRINQKLSQRRHFIPNIKNILFGNVSTLEVVNYIILIAKQFIVFRRAREEEVVLSHFTPFLIKQFQIETVIARKTNNMHKFEERWAPFISQNSTFDI